MVTTPPVEKPVPLTVTVFAGAPWPSAGDDAAGTGGWWPVGAKGHVPSDFVTLTTDEDRVAYRHPSGPTATRSPLVPPDAIGDWARGGRSTSVIEPSRR